MYDIHVHYTCWCCFQNNNARSTERWGSSPRCVYIFIPYQAVLDFKIEILKLSHCCPAVPFSLHGNSNKLKFCVAMFSAARCKGYMDSRCKTRTLHRLSALILCWQVSSLNSYPNAFSSKIFFYVLPLFFFFIATTFFLNRIKPESTFK